MSKTPKGNEDYSSGGFDRAGKAGKPGQSGAQHPAGHKSHELSESEMSKISGGKSASGEKGSASGSIQDKTAKKKPGLGGLDAQGKHGK